MTPEEEAKFIEILDGIKELRLRKSHDYGNSWKVFGLMGVVYQIASKFIRIWNLTRTGKDPKNESLRDSFVDMANYAIMAVQIIDSDEIESKL
jgi:hypothetical protein